jgi:hypothetical protein
MALKGLDYSKRIICGDSRRYWKVPTKYKEKFENGRPSQKFV